MLLGKAGRFFTRRTKTHHDYYHEQCYFCIVLVPKTTAFQFCKAGYKLNQKGGFLPKPTHSLADWRGQGRERSSSHCSEGAPAHQQLVIVKSYTGIIPPEGLWRQTRCFISQECESWQVCTTQAFHFTDFGFSGFSQARRFAPHKRLETPPAESTARAGVPGKMSPPARSRLLSPSTTAPTS